MSAYTHYAPNRADASQAYDSMHLRPSTRPADYQSSRPSSYSRGHSPTAINPPRTLSATTAAATSLSSYSHQPYQQSLHGRGTSTTTGTGKPSPVANTTAVSEGTTYHPLPTTQSSNSSSHQHGFVASDLARRVADLEERLRHIEINEAEGMNVSHKAVRDTLAAAHSLENTSASLEERILKGTRELEEVMEARLQKEAVQRGDMEKHLKQILSDEATVLKETLQHSEGLQKSDIDITLRQVTDQVNKATGHMEGRMEVLRKEMGESIHVLQGTVDDVLSKLGSQRKAQNEAEANLLSLIEETCASLQGEIEEERKQRVASHKHLERVLLEASGRQWTRT